MNIVLTCQDILCVDINVDKRCVDHSTSQVRQTGQHANKGFKVWLGWCVQVWSYQDLCVFLHRNEWAILKLPLWDIVQGCFLASWVDNIFGQYLSPPPFFFGGGEGKETIFLKFAEVAWITKLGRNSAL